MEKIQEMKGNLVRNVAVWKTLDLLNDNAFSHLMEVSCLFLWVQKHLYFYVLYDSNLSMVWRVG